MREPMKVAIFAGRVDTRLAEETEIKPKPSVEIGGRPIFWKYHDGLSPLGKTFPSLILRPGKKLARAYQGARSQFIFSRHRIGMGARSMLSQPSVPSP